MGSLRRRIRSSRGRILRRTSRRNPSGFWETQEEAEEEGEAHEGEERIRQRKWQLRKRMLRPRRGVQFKLSW